MKKLVSFFLLAIALSALHAQTTFPALKLNPSNPKQGKEISFEYDKSKSALSKEATIDVTVYLFSGKTYKIAEPAVSEKGGIYKGSVKPADNSSCIAFVFSSGEKNDLNDGKGYIIPVYASNNIPQKDYYLSAATLNNGMGRSLFGLSKNSAGALSLLEEGLKHYPELKSEPDFLSAYIQTIGNVKKQDAAEMINRELEVFEKSGKLTEQGYNMLIQYHSKSKRAEKAESLLTAMKAAYPNGEWKKTEDMQSIRSAKGADKKVEAYNAYIKNYPPAEKDKQQNNFLVTMIATTYAAEKNYKAYAEWNNKLDKGAAAQNNNNLAWDMAEAGDNLEMAKQMSADASNYAKTEMINPSGTRPETMTSKQWEGQRKNNYAMFGDTYAFTLYKMGEYSTAYPVSKDAATINELKDPEYNERYAMLAEKVLPATETKKLLEDFVKNGTASPKTKEILRSIYTKENNSDKGYDDYLAKLELIAKENKKEAIAKGALNEPSPKFNLKDFEGKWVSLDDLKGKVVVVDFWATWCGPCIASMPGMNKALAKYKENADVKFLFVDTWESVDDKLKNAKAFMEKKNYPFYVLMDTDNKMVEDFNVSGIPTKFIIDKQGNIRFKAVGYGGNADDLVDELTTMIELASK